MIYSGKYVLIKIMIYYLLGIITGLILSVLIVVSKKENARFKIPVMKISNQKAEILETSTEAQEAIAEIIKENDESGKDTKIDEL